MANALDFTGRAVIVTGGTKGIGRRIAARFVEAGAQVVVCARKPPESPTQGVEFVAADLRDVDAIDAVVAHCCDTYGRLDVLVNNAGGSPPADAATVSPRFSEAIIRLNLIVPLNFAQKAHAVMAAQPDGGSIVNIASISGSRPSPGTAAYGAAKAGLLNLTQSLAMEWAPKVRVNAIVAGLIRTEQAELHYGSAAKIEAIEKTLAAGRLGTPDDIANACLYLASPMAAYVTGAQLEVHGGGERPSFLCIDD